MNPADALPEDRRMYYNGCWMRHIRYGIGLVQVDGTEMRFYQFINDETDDTPKAVKPADLVCWWPRAGAYNTPQGAVYISRRAVRTMRKSATPMDHYHIKYGSKYIQHSAMMLIMRSGPAHMDMNTAMNVLSGGAVKSVAITRDIILATGTFGETNVIFRGLNAGEYRDGEFIPSFNGSPLAKRVMHKLAREELRCA